MLRFCYRMCLLNKINFQFFAVPIPVIRDDILRFLDFLILVFLRNYFVSVTDFLFLLLSKSNSSLTDLTRLLSVNEFFSLMSWLCLRDGLVVACISAIWCWPNWTYASHHWHNCYMAWYANTSVSVQCDFIDSGRVNTSSCVCFWSKCSVTVKMVR
jgi:hypothetical protein